MTGAVLLLGFLNLLSLSVTTWKLLFVSLLIQRWLWVFLLYVVFETDLFNVIYGRIVLL